MQGFFLYKRGTKSRCKYNYEDIFSGKSPIRRHQVYLFDVTGCDVPHWRHINVGNINTWLTRCVGGLEGGVGKRALEFADELIPEKISGP